MPGIAGGRDGSPNELYVRVGSSQKRTVGDSSERILHEAGECYEYHYGGGGGWGDPLVRPADRVFEDVLDEYVSIEGARREYGVVLTGSVEEWTLAIDRAETDRLRAEMRREREAH